MFKAQTLRRSFSLFRRVPASTAVNLAARNGHQNIQIQRVRFKRHFITRRRVVGTTLAFVGVYAFLLRLDAIIPDLDEDEEDERDEDDALLFFPTGFSRPKKREFYRGSDPEWQEFVRLSRDRTRIDRIRGELVGYIRTHIAKNLSYTRRLGKINPNAGSIWIEVKFPDGPPIEYERPGYELTEELTLRKTTRPVETAHHKRLESILTPTATATSLFMDTKRRALRSWAGFKTYVGWKSDSTAEPPQVPTSTISVRTSSSNPKTPPSTTTSSSANPSTSASSADSAESEDNPSTTSSSPSSTTTPPSSSSPIIPDSISKRFEAAFPDPTLAPANLPTMNLSYFRMLFRKYNNNNKPHEHDLAPPRGCILVHGLVEIIGDKGKSTLDVAAYYNISSGQYTRLFLKVRSVTDYRQRPKGGD